MASHDLIVRGGRVATAAGSFNAAIAVRDGRIVALGEDLGGAEQVIDAGGRLVTPGGVDAHCHFDQPTGDGSVMADDFRTGSIAAACGGTTTIIPFAAQMKGGSLRAAVTDYHQRADGKAVIDYAFHLIVADPTASVLGQELPALIEDGYTSFKIYMTYDDLKLNDRQILDVLTVARDQRAMTMVHAENTDVIGWLTDGMLAKGQTAPIYHALSRPPLGEREATHRAVTLAELAEVPILIVHVSSGLAAEQIRLAQSRGLEIMGETCPQYLFLTADDLDHPDGAKCICSPPPRDPENQEAIWRGLANGTFQVFSSDHAPFRFDDPKGKYVAGKDAPFTKVPNGIPGVETRLALLLSEGVLKGRIKLEQFVAVTATNPARIYGLEGRKGAIQVGADADIVVWDTDTTRTLTNDMLHHNVDYTPYEGMTLNAWPDVVLSRGEIVAEAGEAKAAPGRGQFLKCDRPLA